MCRGYLAGSFLGDKLLEIPYIKNTTIIDIRRAEAAFLAKLDLGI
jgi:hypothetical protein